MRERLIGGDDVVVEPEMFGVFVREPVDDAERFIERRAGSVDA